jgi:hypothetical protein
MRPGSIRVVRIIKPLAANLALALSGVIVALIIAEAAIRLAGLSYPTMTTFLHADYYTGWSHKPRITFPNPVDGFHGYVTFNREGMRDDREYRMAKPPGTFRIAVIGDSFTEALQVQPQTQDYCSVVEHTLSVCSGLHGKKVEVLNFGVYGFGTAQELIMLRRRVLQWSPDMVVLQFYLNDLDDNTRATDVAGSWGPRPYFALQNGGLVEDDTFRFSPVIRDNVAVVEWNRARKLRPGLAALYGLVSNSRVRELIYHFSYVPIVLPLFHIDRWLEHRIFFSAKQEEPQTTIEQPLASDPRMNDRTAFGTLTRGARTSNDQSSELERYLRYEGVLLGPPQRKGWIESWRVTEELIAEVNKEARAHGARFLLVIADASSQVYPDPNLRHKVLPDPFYLNHRLEALGERDGFPVSSLAEPLQRYADEHHVFLHGINGRMLGWGHWNTIGHRVVGALISAKICAMLQSEQERSDGPAARASAPTVPAKNSLQTKIATGAGGKRSLP